jgi:hypothetical protein
MNVCKAPCFEVQKLMHMYTKEALAHLPPPVCTIVLSKGQPNAASVKVTGTA